MDPKQTREVPEGEEWQHEPKLDGYRGIVVRQGKDTVLFSRRGHVFHRRFPGLAKALQALPGKAFTLDGEIVTFDEAGRMSFELVQEPRRGYPLHFIAFDLLQYGGQDLINLPLHARRQRLEAEFRWPAFTRLCPVLQGPVPSLLATVRRLGLEGLVAKRRDSVYEPGRRPGTWLKHKEQVSDDFVIGGYLRGTRFFDELLVGQWQGHELRFVESVKDGFIPHTKRKLLDLLRKSKTSRCPFSNLPEKGAGTMNLEKMSRIQWVKPRLVVEVAFNNWTQNGHLRHARFLRVRLDKA